MEFFDKLGKKASEAYKMTADKTGKIAKETKNKLKIGELKTQVSDLYEEIGKKVYEKHVREENIDIKNELEELCTKIDAINDDIESLLKECLALKDKKQCPKCYKEIEKNVKFCPYCGEKQTEDPVTEVEILEDLENSEVEEDNEIEKQIVIEELENDIEEKSSQDEVKTEVNSASNENGEIKDEEEQDKEFKDLSQNEDNEDNDEEREKSNLEKTVEVESDVDIEENGEAGEKSNLEKTVQVESDVNLEEDGEDEN